jgi:cell division transport system permease protein
MFAWLFASQSERSLLGGGRLRGPTPWVIAIMSFSIVIVAAAGLALANAAALVAKSAESRYSVQVPNGSRNLPALLRIVRSAPGVASAQAVPESSMRQTLEQWLGPAARSSDLPVPALINFDVRPGARLSDIERSVKGVAPDVVVTAHREALGPLVKSLEALQGLALGLAMLLAAASAAAVVLAARGALDTHRFTIDVMHGVGATDVQVTRLFQRKIAIDAFVGSIGGAAAAGLVLLVLLSRATFVGDLTGGASISLRDLIILALIPLALTMLATWVARATVLAALRQSL